MLIDCVFYEVDESRPKDLMVHDFISERRAS